MVENQPKILPILTADMAISYLFSPAIYGRVLPGHFMVQSFIYYKSPNVSMGLFSRCRHDNAYVIPHLPARRLPAICLAGLFGGSYLSHACPIFIFRGFTWDCILALQGVCLAIASTHLLIHASRATKNSLIFLPHNNIM